MRKWILSFGIFTIFAKVFRGRTVVDISLWAAAPDFSAGAAFAKGC